MSIHFQVDGVHLPATQRLPSPPIMDVEKPRILERLMRFGRGVVAGGRHLKGALMRLVNAKSTLAVGGLTSLSDTASTALSLGTMYPRGSGGSSNSRYFNGLRIMRSRSDGLPAPTPSNHLVDARRRLRLTLLATHPLQTKLDSPIVQLNNDVDVREPMSSTLSMKDIERAHHHLYTVNEDSPSPKMNETGQVKILGCEGVICARVVSRFPNGTFYTIIGAEGNRYSMERVSVEDEDSRQELANELNALRRVRALQGIANLDVVEERGKDTYILTKWLGDITLMDFLHKDKCYSLEFTVNQMARLLHGIHCMHRCGVIHCGVSTENIMTGGPDENFTLFNFSSSTLSTKDAPVDGDIPLWVPDGKALGLIDRKCRARSPYYDDYVALGHIWHEMRTREKPINLGFGNYGVREGILFTDEMLFIRRLLTTDVDYRFKSVGELKRHAVFKEIDWRRFDSH